jgi:hypothetical protein
MKVDHTMPRPDTLSDEHVRAFGSITAYWANYEALLETIIVAVYGLDEARGRAFTATLNYAGKRDMLRAMAAAKENKKDNKASAFYEVIEEVLDKAQSLADLRNLVAHALWRPGKRPRAIEPLIHGARGEAQSRSRDGKSRDYTSDDLHDEATAIFVLWTDLHEAAVRHGVLAAPSAKTDNMASRKTKARRYGRNRNSTKVANTTR